MKGKNGLLFLTIVFLFVNSTAMARHRHRYRYKKPTPTATPIATAKPAPTPEPTPIVVATPTPTVVPIVPGLSVDSEGWTSVIAPAGAKVIYVSSSQGNDCATSTDLASNFCKACATNNSCGLSSSYPLKTMKKGFAMLTNGSSDQILFKRGDIFTEGDGNEAASFIRFKKTGPSDSKYPMVIGSYGPLSEERPIFKTGNLIAFKAWPGAGTATLMQNVVLQGIHFSAHVRNPSLNNSDFIISAGTRGITLQYVQKNFLIEDCKVEFYNLGLSVEGSASNSAQRPQNITLRRNMIVDSYNAFSIGDSGDYDTNHSSDSDKKSQGIYADYVNGFIIEENILDRNGWYPDNGSILAGDARPTMYNHNVYLNTHNSGVKFNRNIVMRASSHGIQLRPGGEANDNLFVQNALALLVGSNNTGNKFDSTIHNNVILKGTDIVPELPRGMGIEIVSSIPSVSMRSNLIANILTTNKYAKNINNASSGVSYSGNIIWNWPGSGGMYNSSSGPFLDINRGVESYNASQGHGSTFDSFADYLRSQRRGHWDSNYSALKINSYIRAGFNMSVAP